MTKVGLGVFSKEEYLSRVAACKSRMAEKEIDVLFISDPANMNYLTGYDAWSFYVSQCVLLEIDRPEPVWIGRGIDAPGVPVTTYLKPENTYSYMDNYVHATDCHAMDYIADVLIQRGLENAVIGVEMNSFYFTAREYELMKYWLPNATIKDNENLVNWQRLIKSEDEIALMRQAGKIMDRVMNHAIEIIEPGMRKNDLVAQIAYDQIYGTEDFGGDYTSIVPMIPSGIHTGVPHLHWTDQPFNPHEVVVLELAAARHHYHCPMARTVFLGDTPRDLERIAKVAEEGVEEALQVVQAGIVAEEIEQAFREVLAKHGFIKASRIGYSTGLNFPPDWGEHTVSLRGGEKTILEPDMCFHMIPALWGDNWGVEISQTFRVTENGYEPLGNVPRNLFVK